MVLKMKTTTCENGVSKSEECETAKDNVKERAWRLSFLPTPRPELFLRSGQAPHRSSLFYTYARAGRGYWSGPMLTLNRERGRDGKVVPIRCPASLGGTRTRNPRTRVETSLIRDSNRVMSREAGRPRSRYHHQMWSLNREAYSVLSTKTDEETKNRHLV